MVVHSDVAAVLARELEWFARVLELRIQLYFQQPSEYETIYELAPPDLQPSASPYAEVVSDCGFGFDERVVLALAMIPHIRPQALDILFVRNKDLDRGYTEFGGWRGNRHGGFLPTLETAAFILSGDDIAARMNTIRLFTPGHPLMERGILDASTAGGDEPFLSSALSLSPEYLSRLTLGQTHKPDFSARFPAKRIVPRLTWGELVLAPTVMEEIETIRAWIVRSEEILGTWGLRRVIKPGYRALFYGPPGTGKTLTAGLLGAELGLDVYRVDLSMVVSKYIGETEKNLAGIFDQAENRNWILFFDEADALFGKRTQTSSSNDRHANQEIAYLLQRIEEFPGTVILASNLKGNIDEAFTRRFQSMVYFPLPDAEQRRRLWHDALGGDQRMAPDVDIDTIARNYELSGGAIINVVRYSAIRALKAGRESVNHEDIITGVLKELRKEGKTL